MALVALLAGKGACVAGARDKIKETREQMWKDGLEEHLSAQSGAGDRLYERVGGGGVWQRKDSNLPPSLRSGALLTGGTSQNIDFGVCPPNDKQLNSLAHVLAIMCLGLRLNIDSIETVAEVSEPCTKDNINLAFYPCEMGTGGEVIRSRTQEVLDDMKKGLYRTINPNLVNRPIWVEKEI